MPRHPRSRRKIRSRIPLKKRVKTAKKSPVKTRSK